MIDQEKIKTIEQFFEYLFILPGKKVKWLKEYQKLKTEDNTYVDIICDAEKDFSLLFDSIKRNPVYDKSANKL